MEFGVETTETSTECRRDDFFLTFCGCESLDAGQFTSQARPKKCRCFWFGLNTQWILANMCCMFTGTLDPLLCWCISLMSPLEFCWILGTRHVKHQMIFKVHSSPMCVEQRDITRPFQLGCNSRILEGFWRGCLLGATMATWHGLPIARCPAEHVSGPGSTNRSHQRQKSEKHWGSWRF